MKKSVAKKITSICAIAALVFSMSTLPANAQKAASSSSMTLKAASITVKVNGTAIKASGKTAPKKSGSGIIAPANTLAKALKAKYSKKNKTVTLKKGSKKLVFTVGKKTAKLGKKTVKLKAKTVLKGSTPMIEAATTATKLGFKTAKFESSKNTLYIASAKLSGKLVINEVCSYNKTCFADENGKHTDWVELYNGTYEDINLNGYFMTDKAEKPQKSKIEGNNTTIKSGGYLIIALSGNSTLAFYPTYTHLTFRLSKEGGETVYLVKPDGKTIVDKAALPALDADKTFGRKPNGTGSFGTINTPTPGKAN